jgi:glucose-6-phosphate 1-dehydrogenase
MDLDEFYRRETKYIKKNENDAALAKTFDEQLSVLKKISSYVSGQYDTDEGFQHLREHLEKLEDERSGSKSPRNRVFYMALPPSVFTVVAKGLKKNVYSESGKNRIIVEKPFGKDTESCREMMSALKAEWAENETYRIDHYLGKEMIKNMLVLRFGNVFLDACMNRNFISNVQITFKEPFGTEGRGGYFDEFGIIRDVCQNREWRSRGLELTLDLMQTLSVLAMERPVSFSAEDVRDEKVRPVPRPKLTSGQSAAMHPPDRQEGRALGSVRRHG